MAVLRRCNASGCKTDAHTREMHTRAVRAITCARASTSSPSHFYSRPMRQTAHSTQTKVVLFLRGLLPFLEGGRVGGTTKRISCEMSEVFVPAMIRPHKTGELVLEAPAQVMARTAHAPASHGPPAPHCTPAPVGRRVRACQPGPSRVSRVTTRPRTRALS